MQHGTTVGIVGAVMVGLDGRHWVIFTNALLVFLLQILHDKESNDETI